MPLDAMSLGKVHARTVLAHRSADRHRARTEGLNIAIAHPNPYSLPQGAGENGKIVNTRLELELDHAEILH